MKAMAGGFCGACDCIFSGRKINAGRLMNRNYAENSCRMIVSVDDIPEMRREGFYIQRVDIAYTVGGGKLKKQVN